MDQKPEEQESHAKRNQDFGFVRAGLTCVKFFTGDSGGSTAVSECTTISDLHGRLHYLDRAGQHFKTALNKGGMDPASESEVRGHLDVIALQKEVVNHMYQSAQVMGTLNDPLRDTLKPPSDRGPGEEDTPEATPSQPPVTLFGDKCAHEGVAIQVMVLSNDVMEGFRIARKLIEHFKLDSRLVLCETARGLALKQGYTEIRGLVQCVQKTHSPEAGVPFDLLNNDVVMAAIEVFANQMKEQKLVQFNKNF